MTQGNGLERLLRELSAPRRNHYFYGKLMDVSHFELEQTYVNHKRWLLNQQALGYGVLCGLGVSAQGGELCVDPGMAIDEYGREIIKPVRTCIDPWTIPDPCAEPGSALSKEIGHRVSLWICFKECLTDPMPVLVSECGDEQDSAAGTLVETFELQVREGVPDPDPPALDPSCCEVLLDPRSGETEPLPDPESGGVRDAREPPELIERLRQELRRCTARACRKPASACVLLAVVELLPGGRIGRIEQCGQRRRIYSNQVLLDLILCLAARLEECCKGPGGEVERPPKVEQVQVLDIAGDVLAEVGDPSEVLAFTDDQHVRGLRFVFTEDMEKASVVAGAPGKDPAKISFLVTKPDAGLAAGTLTFEDAHTLLWSSETDALPPGRYRVRLSGGGAPTTGRPAVRSRSGVALDGERLGRLPSGDGTPGGDFGLSFQIGEEAKTEAPKVSSLYLVSAQNQVLAYVTDPRDVPEIELGANPKSIRMNFTSGIDPESLVFQGSDPTKLNLTVTHESGQLVPGDLKPEGPQQLLWSYKGNGFGPGSYKLELFGDPDAPAGRPAIAGTNGLRLDGESDHPLPSGDDKEGGNFSFGFKVVNKSVGGDER